MIPEKTSIQIDHSKSNPSLHALYVKNACGALALIDRAIRELENRHSLSLLGMISAMRTERARLLREEAAYRDADEILKEIARSRNPEEADHPEEIDDCEVKG